MIARTCSRQAGKEADLGDDGLTFVGKIIRHVYYSKSRIIVLLVLRGAEVLARLRFWSFGDTSSFALSGGS